MLQLRAYAPPERVDSAGQLLAAVAGLRHVIVGGRTAGNMVQFTAEPDVDVADVVLELLATNVAGIVAGSTLTLTVQRRTRRQGRMSAGPP